MLCQTRDLQDLATVATVATDDAIGDVYKRYGRAGYWPGAALAV